MTTAPEKLSAHVVLVGFGRVGRMVAAELAAQGMHYLVAEQNREKVDQLRRDGQAAVAGNAAEPEVLIQAHIARAAVLVVAIPDTFHVRAMIVTARALNPGIAILVRSHSESEAALLRQETSCTVLLGEQELAHSLARQAKAYAQKSTAGPDPSR